MKYRIHTFLLFIQKPKTIKSIIHPIEFVPETMLISETLDALIKKRKSIAVVLDEYGGTSGMMTVEDIIEELFGEIDDEYDNINLTEEQITDNAFHFSARQEIDYINEKFKLNLPDEEQYETIGGLIVYNTEEIIFELQIPQNNSKNNNERIIIRKYKKYIKNFFQNK